VTRHVPDGDGEHRLPPVDPEVRRLRLTGWRFAAIGIVAVVVGQIVATRHSTMATSLWTIVVGGAALCLVGAVRNFRNADRLRRDQPERP
jgi:hypothetical protein